MKNKYEKAHQISLQELDLGISSHRDEFDYWDYRSRYRIMERIEEEGDLKKSTVEESK
jgi:hypothetical protein